MSLPGRLLRRLAAARSTVIAPLGAGWGDELRVIRETRARVPLLLSDAAALQIRIAVRATRRLSGAMAEAGVFAGASARLICAAKGDAPLHLFDVFDTLQNSAPGPTPAEADVRAHFGTTHGRLAEVRRLLAPYPAVHFHPGVFPASAAGLEDERFSFVHLDLDLPRATLAGLDFFVPRLVAGGILIGDDYADAEVRATFAAFFANRRDTIIELPWAQVMIIKQG